MAGWLRGVLVGAWLFVFPLCGFSISLFCNYPAGFPSTRPLLLPVPTPPAPLLPQTLCFHMIGSDADVDVYAFTWCGLGVWLFVGLLCLLQRCIALEFGWVSLGLHCFLRLSSAGLIVVLISGSCWAYPAFSV